MYLCAVNGYLLKLYVRYEKNITCKTEELTLICVHNIAHYLICQVILLPHN